VIVDPSHGTGHSYLVADMAAASVAAVADGLIVEMHPNPEKAMSDGYQSLDFNQFQEMMNRCSVIAKALGKTFG
jgi:3-deoxy-7-phosphoheptulonate synthase